MRTPIAIPDLSGNEQKYVADAIASTWISSTGEYVDRFEREFARLCTTDHAIAVANGTVALHLALLAIGVGPGDEVILPSLTYISTANAVKYVGASPVFVDVDPHSWCMDPREVKKAITDRTRAIIAVHLYGNVCEMDELDSIASRNKLWLIEDAAEAPLATYRESLTGSMGDIATFSFYGNKIITCGEGGAITTNNDVLAKRIRQLRGQGMDPERRYYFPVVGYNYRLTNVACAILCAQLERVGEIVERRREIVNRYRSNLESAVRFQGVSDYVTPSPWLFSVTTPLRKRVVDALMREGVETRPFFEPIHTLPPYVNDRAHGRMMYTLELASNGFNLPTYPGLADEEVDSICDIIERAR